ncbi:hypothetical protein KEM54_003103, partial [Ascosphaera aggregata]
MSDGSLPKAVGAHVDSVGGHSQCPVGSCQDEQMLASGHTSHTNFQPGLVDQSRKSDTGRSTSGSRIELPSGQIRPSPSSGKENQSIGRQSIDYNEHDDSEMHSDGLEFLQAGSNPSQVVNSEEKQLLQQQPKLYDNEQSSQGQPSEMLSLHSHAETNLLKSDAITSQLPTPQFSPGESLESGMESSQTHLTTQSSLPPRQRTLQFTSNSVAPTPRKSTVPVSVVEEKRKEAYNIRHVIWQRRVNSPVQCIPILVQNENGPCPLLALVNAIVLRAVPPINSSVIKALKSRERISLGLLIQVLLEELVNTTKNNLPDIEELTSFLTMLHTGMNVNPCLLHNTDLLSNPVYFQQTSDIDLYSSFGIPLVHGWLATPSSKTAQSLKKRHAEYHEDTELLQIAFDQFTERILGGDVLTIAEETEMADVERILQFTRVENATQLSEFGLKHLRDTLKPGSISILFRNNHFSTLYKHPESCRLFTLISDAGFADRPEVVWESLDDVTGKQTKFYSGDFRLVGGNEGAPEPAFSTAPTGTSPSPAVAAIEGTGPGCTEQEDADYAYALQLQEEEQARQQQQGNSACNSTPARNSSDRAHKTRPQKGRPPPPSYEESKFDRRLVADVTRERRNNS